MKYLFLFLLSLSAHAASLYTCTKPVNEVSYYACGDGEKAFTTTPTAATPVIVPQSPQHVGPVGADGGEPAKWVRFDSLASTALVAVCELSGGKCLTSGIQAYGLKSDFSATTPPPVVQPPTTSTSPIVLNWSAPTQSVGGGPVTVTGYHVRWSGAASGEAFPGNVLTYSINGVAGSYSATVASIDATGESSPSNAVNGTITATPPITPPVIPPVIPPPVVVEVLGTYTLKKGTANVQTGLTDYSACKAAAVSLATSTATKYLCNVSHSVTVSK